MSEPRTGRTSQQKVSRTSPGFAGVRAGALSVPVVLKVQNPTRIFDCTLDMCAIGKEPATTNGIVHSNQSQERPLRPRLIPDAHETALPWFCPLLDACPSEFAPGSIDSIDSSLAARFFVCLTSFCQFFFEHALKPFEILPQQGNHASHRLGSESDPCNAIGLNRINLVNKGRDSLKKTEIEHSSLCRVLCDQQISGQKGHPLRDPIPNAQLIGYRSSFLFRHGGRSRTIVPVSAASCEFAAVDPHRCMSVSSDPRAGQETPVHRRAGGTARRSEGFYHAGTSRFQWRCPDLAVSVSQIRNKDLLGLWSYRYDARKTDHGTWVVQIEPDCAGNCLGGGVTFEIARKTGAVVRAVSEQ